MNDYEAAGDTPGADGWGERRFVSNRSNGAGQLVMMQIGLIGIGAGAAAALLFASATSGSWLAIVLFYLAPLPIMIAALGWGHWAALIATGAGALSIALVFGSIYFLAFVAGIGIPAWWLGYLAMLARPAGGAVTAQGAAVPPLEWYPPGRLVVWAAVLAAAFAVLLNFGISTEGVRDQYAQSVAALFRTETGHLPDPERSKRLVAFLVEAIPPAAAVAATLTYVVNLWLAAFAVKFSGRLARPWPALSAMTFPRLAAAALAIAVMLSFVGGIIGIAAGILTAALLMAFGVLGFAVLHAITQGMNARGFLLGSTYAAVLVFGWPMLALCLVGIVDAVFDLRGRIARKRGPPAPT